MKKHGILNSEISKVLSDFGHTDQITIGDCGLPVPSMVKKIDLAVKIGKPSFIEVLKEVLNDMAIEKIILAEEIKTANQSMLKDILDLISEDIEIEFIPHSKFKRLTSDTKAIIRTGEASPFSNIILQSDVIF